MPPADNFNHGTVSEFEFQPTQNPIAWETELAICQNYSLYFQWIIHAGHL